MIESVFRNFLLKSAAVSALIGTRAYQDRAPQNATYPLIVLRKHDSDGDHDHGYLPDHSQTRYRVLGASKTYDELIDLREALKGLDGFALPVSVAAGHDVDFNVPGTQLQSAVIAFERDEFEESSQLFTLITDWQISNTETYVPGITV